MRQLIAVIFFSLVTVSAQELTPSAALEKIQQQYSGMNDASAFFTQTVSIRFKKTDRIVSGTVKIKKGNKYRVVTDQQTIVTDGVTVWMYNPITKQVLKDSFKQNRQPFSPDKFLLGLPKEFIAADIKKDSHYYVLSLQPAKTGATSSMISGLRIWVKPETWIVEKIEAVDKNKMTTTITLSAIEFNKGISDKEFQFAVSADMKVVDLKAIQ